MARVRLNGLHFTHKKMADGSRKTYWYAWKGGPRLTGEPGSPEFMASLSEAMKGKKEAAQSKTFSTLCDHFQDSKNWPANPKTAKDYRRHIDTAKAEFGPLTYSDIEARGSRALFLEWRDEVAEKRGARTADYAMTVIARVLSWAADREIISRNPLERIGRLHNQNRADCVWTLADEAALLAVASPPVALAFMLGVWTGQRQKDILRMPWKAYDGRSIAVRQGKTGAAVRIPVGGPLKSILDATPKKSAWIVTTERAKGGGDAPIYGSYTSDGFRSSFAAACKEAGIVGLTFHDTRGTFSTRAQEGGATEAETASVTGHIKNPGNTLNVSYTSYTYLMAESCIKKLEAWHEARTNHQTVHQTGDTAAINQ